MFSNRMPLLSAELFLLLKRTGTWLMLGIWSLLALAFSYVVPYLTYRSAGGNTRPGELEQLLPANLVGRMIDGFPFWGGAIALMVGVLAIGSEFGWDTLKTLFSQRPGRGQVFAAKLGAIAIILIPYVILPFSVGAIASSYIGWREGVGFLGPDMQTIVEGIMAAWLVLAVWAAVGVLLAVATRGTSLAIGIGILYTLVIEGLVSALATQVELLEPLLDVFVRANAYSLLRPLGGAGNGEVESAATDGPGAFSGPYVDEMQALVVMVGYLILFLGASLWMLRRRDVD